LLAWRPDSLAAHRARLLTVVATLGCMRVNEAAQLQVCDLWFDYLMSYGCPASRGRARCTSTGGRMTRSARDTTPRSAARGIQSWMWWRSCAAGWSSRGSRCIWRGRSGRGRRRHASSARRCSCSRTALARRAARAVHAAAGELLDSLGGQGSRGESSHFSGISARKWGILTVIEARVDETILYLQSVMVPHSRRGRTCR
jgi:hypothetical protein